MSRPDGRLHAPPSRSNAGTAARVGEGAQTEKLVAVCIDPARVHAIWPHVSSLIERAMRRGGLSRFVDVEHAALGGRLLLWIVWNGAAIVGAVVTDLVLTDAGKVCVIVAFAGTELRQQLELLPQIESYARAEGCTRVRIFGRTGWARVLKGFAKHGVILDRRL